jgi:hypothetical protein
MTQYEFSHVAISDEPCPNCKGEQQAYLWGFPCICALCNGIGKMTAFGKSCQERAGEQE